MNVSPTSPKAQWLADAKTAQEWEEMTANPIFKKAMTYALAEFANSPRDMAQLLGVAQFRNILTTLSAVQEPGRLPSKELQQG